MHCESDNWPKIIPISFGISCLIMGPEFKGTFAECHVLTLNRLANIVFIDVPLVHDFPNFSITLEIAGELLLTLESKVGKVRFSKKYREFDANISLSLKSFTELSEAEFRVLLSNLILEASEKVASDKRANQINIDPDDIRNGINELLRRYMALDLPITYDPPQQSELPPIDLRPEYFFLFNDLFKAKGFIEQLDLSRFETDWDGEEIEDEDYYIRIVDKINLNRVAKIEKELVQLAESAGGEYDGWSAV